MKSVFQTASPYLKDALNLPVETLENALPFYETVMGFRVLSRQTAPCQSAILGRDAVQIGLATRGHLVPGVLCHCTGRSVLLPGRTARLKSLWAHARRPSHAMTSHAMNGTANRRGRQEAPASRG